MLLEPARRGSTGTLSSCVSDPLVLACKHINAVAGNKTPEEKHPMSINDPRIEALRIEALREKFTEMRWRKYRGARYQFRFVMFLNRIEKFERARLRMARPYRSALRSFSLLHHHTRPLLLLRLRPRLATRPRSR